MNTTTRSDAVRMRSVAVTMAFLAYSTLGYARDTGNARELYEQATVQFRLGKFHDAGQTYERVFELHHDTALLYNIAQSYRLANEPDKALFFYRSYLSSSPDATNRDEVTARIKELEQLVATNKKVTERPPNEPAVANLSPTKSALPPSALPNNPAKPVGRNANDRPHGHTLVVAGATVAGIGIVSLATGITLESLAKRDADQLNNLDRSGGAYNPSKLNQGKQFDSAGIATLAVGGAAVVVGAALAIVGARRSKHERVAVMPLLSTSTAGAVVRFGF